MADGEEPHKPSSATGSLVKSPRSKRNGNTPESELGAQLAVVQGEGSPPVNNDLTASTHNMALRPHTGAPAQSPGCRPGARLAGIGSPRKLSGTMSSPHPYARPGTGSVMAASTPGSGENANPGSYDLRPNAAGRQQVSPSHGRSASVSPIKAGSDGNNSASGSPQSNLVVGLNEVSPNAAAQSALIAALTSPIKTVCSPAMLAALSASSGAGPSGASAGSSGASRSLQDNTNAGLSDHPSAAFTQVSTLYARAATSPAASSPAIVAALLSSPAKNANGNGSSRNAEEMMNREESNGNCPAPAAPQQHGSAGGNAGSRNDSASMDRGESNGNRPVPAPQQRRSLPTNRILPEELIVNEGLGLRIAEAVFPHFVIAREQGGQRELPVAGHNRVGNHLERSNQESDEESKQK